MAEIDAQLYQGGLDTRHIPRPKQFPQTWAATRRCGAEVLRKCTSLFFVRVTPPLYVSTLMCTGIIAALLQLAPFTFEPFALFHIGLIAVSFSAWFGAHVNHEVEAPMITTGWGIKVALRPSNIKAEHQRLLYPAHTAIRTSRITDSKADAISMGLGFFYTLLRWIGASTMWLFSARVWRQIVHP